MSNYFDLLFLVFMNLFLFLICCLLAAPQLKHVLPTGEPIWGVACLENHLYVLRSRSADRLEVYGIPDFSFQRHLLVPKLRGLADMASSTKDRCLYLVDCVDRDVHSVHVKNPASISWPVNDDPWGISVTSSNNVVITCDEACKLKIFSSTGNLLQEIPLCPNMPNPSHAVETVDGNFVVCYGAETDTFRGVCRINAGGYPLISLSGGAAGHMTKPCHIAVDDDGFVLVADANDKVRMLSPRLSYIWEAASPSNGLRWRPWRLAVDRQRLYVADNEFVDGKWTSGRVVVFDL